MPIEMSAKPRYWAMSAPHMPTNPFDRANVRVLVKSVETPNEEIMGPLSPVARMDRPRSVVRNHRTTNPSSRTTTARMATPGHSPSRSASFRGVNTVSLRSSGMFAPSMIRRLTDHSAIMVRIPARRPSILPLVCSNPVTVPARNPVPKPARVASTGFQPARMPMAAVAAPVVKLPSTVRSGKLSTRKVR